MSKVKAAALVALKPALATLRVAFVVILIPALLSWLNNWASLFAEGHVAVPDVSTLGAALFALGSAAIIALGNFLLRFLQALGVVPWGQLPAYTPVKEVLPDGHADMGPAPVADLPGDQPQP